MSDYINVGPVQEDTSTYIDIGPFFDRFGAAQLAVLMSSDAVVKAWIQSVMVRKWVDLRHPAVPLGIDAIIAAGVDGVDLALKEAILTTPISYAEQSALLALYFK